MRLLKTSNKRVLGCLDRDGVGFCGCKVHPFSSELSLVKLLFGAAPGLFAGMCGEEGFWQLDRLFPDPYNPTFGLQSISQVCNAQ